MKLKLSAPKLYTWIVAVVLGALGVIGRYVNLPLVTKYDFWLVVLGLVVLILGTLLDQL